MLEYDKWLGGSTPHSDSTATLGTVKRNLLSTSLRRWSLGSEDLRDWYVTCCQRYIDAALDDRLQRWDHRARTTEIVRHVRADRGEVLTRLIEKLSQLSLEENENVPNLEDRRRVRAWVHPTEYRVEGGYSGEFLERARLAIADIGAHLNVGMCEVPPLDFCLRILLRELVCEREPLYNPEVARLNGAQLQRYLWAPTSGDSNTPDSGQLLSLCESFSWYGRRLLGFLNFPDARSLGSGTEDSPKSSRPFIPAEIAGPPRLPHSDDRDDIKPPTARRRGRPSQIPEARKLLALSAKGNRNRAQILYETKFPTPQQVKNVSSILRHYQRRSRQAE